MDTSNDPDYKSIVPPEDKPPAEFSWAERRAELFDLIEERGHHRALERSQRELGNRYGVSRKTISKDIKRLNAWKAERMGDGADAELVTLYNKAVQYHLDNNDPDKAFEVANTHYKTLMDAANAEGQERAADKKQHEHSGEFTQRHEHEIDDESREVVLESIRALQRYEGDVERADTDDS